MTSWNRSITAAAPSGAACGAGAVGAGAWPLADGAGRCVAVSVLCVIVRAGAGAGEGLGPLVGLGGLLSGAPGGAGGRASLAATPFAVFSFWGTVGAAFLAPSGSA